MTGSHGSAVGNATEIAYHRAADLPGVRAFAADQARRRGLATEAVQAVTLAVSELVTNTLQHTDAGGRLRVWADDTAVYYDVLDSGPMRTFGRSMPEPEAERGRGLAIVERLCDEVTAIAVPDGTVVRLRFALRSPQDRPDSGPEAAA